MTLARGRSRAHDVDTGCNGSSRLTTIRTSIAVCVLALLAGCGNVVGGFSLEDGSTHEGNVSVVNGGIDVGRDCVVNGRLKSVNGSVAVGESSSVGDIANVNGSIRIGRGVRVGGGIESVNGSVDLGEELAVENDIETVNGRIVVAAGSEIGGGLSSVNGRIEVAGSRVGSIMSHNGGILLESGTEIAGGITMKKPSGGSLGVGSPPRVVIGRNVRVEGELTFEREVRLHVHESAHIGPVSGADPVRYSGERP